MNHRQKGFTLTELLIAVAVIGILAAVAAPAFTKMIEKRRLLAALENVHSHVQFTRSEAVKIGRDTSLNLRIKTGTPWCLGIDNTSTTCDCTITYVDAATTPTACSYGPTGSVVSRTLLGTDYPNVALTTTNGNLQVGSDRGDFSTASETITLTSSPTSYVGKIIVSRLGKVSMCTVGSLGGYPACP